MIVEAATLLALAAAKPNKVFQQTFGDTHYICGQWGSPPRLLKFICVPVKQPAKGAA